MHLVEYQINAVNARMAFSAYGILHDLSIYVYSRNVCRSYGTQRGINMCCYKHIVPTELKM